MSKTIESVTALLGRKPDKDEKVIFDLMKDDDLYEFKKGKNGFLEAHRIKDEFVIIEDSHTSDQ